MLGSLATARRSTGHALANGSAILSLVAVSCGPTPAGPAGNLAASAAAVSPPSASDASFEQGPWGTFRSKRFELALRLPDGGRWKIDDHRTPWLKAEHPPTQSSLWWRAWSEEVIATRQGCYARAREWLPQLPELERASLIDDRVRPLFASVDTRVAVGVGSTGSTGSTGSAGSTGSTRSTGSTASTALRTQGFVVAAGAAARRCLVLAFVTHAEGAGADDAVGGRLALVSERLLERVQLDQSFAPSREPVTPSLRGAPGAVR